MNTRHSPPDNLPVDATSDVPYTDEILDGVVELVLALDRVYRRLLDEGHLGKPERREGKPQSRNDQQETTR